MDGKEDLTVAADDGDQIPEDGSEQEDIVFTEGMDEFDAVSGMISVLGNGITVMHEPRFKCIGGVVRTFDPEKGFGLELRFYEGCEGDRLRVQVSAMGNTVSIGKLCGYVVGGCKVAIPFTVELTRLGLTPLDGITVLVDGREVISFEERVDIGFSEGIQARFRKDYDMVAFRPDCGLVMEPSPELDVYTKFGTNIIQASEGVRIGHYLILDDRVRWPNVRGKAGEMAITPEKDYPTGWEKTRSILDDPNGAKKIILKNEYRYNMHPSYRKKHYPANRLLGDVPVIYTKTGFFLKIPPYEKLAGEKTVMRLCYDRTVYSLDMGVTVSMGGCEHITGQFVSLSDIGRSPLEGFYVTVNGRTVYSTRSRQVMLFDRRGMQVDSLCGEGYVVSDHTHKLISEGMRYLESGYSQGCRISRVYIPYGKASEIARAEHPNMEEIEPENRNFGFRHMKPKEPEKEAEKPENKPVQKKTFPDIPAVDPMPPKDISSMDFGSFVEDSDYDRFEQRLRNALGKSRENGRTPSHGLLMEPASLRLADSEILLTFGAYEFEKKDKLEIMVTQGDRTVRIRGRPGKYEIGGRCITGLYDMCPGFMGLDPLGDLRVTVDGYTVAELPRRDSACFDHNGRLVSEEGASVLWYRPELAAVSNGKPLDFRTKDGLKVTELGRNYAFCICPIEETETEEEPVSNHPKEAGTAIIGRPVTEEKLPETVENNTVAIPKKPAKDTVSIKPHFVEDGVTVKLEGAHILLDIPPYVGKQEDNFLMEIGTDGYYVQAGLLPRREGTRPLRTRSARIDLTVLGISPVKPFTLYIDRNEVYRNELQFLMFDLSGDQTYDRGSAAFLVTNISDKVRIDCSGTFRHEEAFGLRIYDLRGCRNTRFSVFRKRPSGQTGDGNVRTSHTWFSMDGRRCMLNLPRYPDTDGGSLISVECRGKTVTVGSASDNPPLGDAWVSFAPAEHGICPLDIMNVCIDGELVDTTRNQTLMMFDPDGDRLRYPEEDTCVVCRPTSIFDYRGCRVVDGEDTEILMYRRLLTEGSSAFHVRAPLPDAVYRPQPPRSGFDKLYPKLLFFDGDIVVSMPRYHGGRDAALECWIEQDGKRSGKVKLRRIDRPNGSETVPQFIPFLSEGFDPLAGFSLVLDGVPLHTEEDKGYIMFGNNGTPTTEPVGETLVVSRAGTSVDAGESEILDRMTDGDLEFTQIYVQSRFKVRVRTPEPEPVAEEAPEPAAECVPESEPAEPEPAVVISEEPLEPEPAEPETPSRDVTTLSFDDFFGVRDTVQSDSKGIYHIGVHRRFLKLFPNLYFDMDHMTLDIPEYIGSFNDPFECWLEQDGRESEHFILEGSPREYDVVTKACRLELDSLEIDPLDDFDLYIDGQRAYYYRSPGVLFFDNAGNRMPRPSGETLVVCPAEGDLETWNAELKQEMVLDGVRYALFSVSYSGSVWYHPPNTETPEDGKDRPEEFPEIPEEEPIAEEKPADTGSKANLMFCKFRFCIDLPPYEGLKSDRFELSLDAGDKIFPLGRMEYTGIPGGRRSVPTKIYLDEMGLSPFNALQVTVDNKVVFSKEPGDIIFMDSDFRMVQALAGYRNIIYPRDSIIDWSDLEPLRRSILGNIAVLTVDAGPDAAFTVERTGTTAKELTFLDEKPDVFYRDGAFYLHMPPMRVIGDHLMELSIRHNGRTVPTCILGHRTSITAPADINITDLGTSPLDGFEVIIDGKRVHTNWETKYILMDSTGHRTIMPVGKGFAAYRRSDDFTMFDIGVIGTRNVGSCVVSEITLSGESRFVPANRIIDTLSNENGKNVCEEATATITFMDAPTDFESYYRKERVTLCSRYPEIGVNIEGCDRSECRIRVVNKDGETVFGPVPVMKGRMTLNTYNARGLLSAQVIAGDRILGSELYIHDYTFYYQVPEGHILTSEDIIRFCVGSRVYSFTAYDKTESVGRFRIQGTSIWLKWRTPIARLRIEGKEIPFDQICRDYIPATDTVGIKTKSKLPCRFMLGNKERGFVKAQVEGGQGKYVFHCMKQIKTLGPGKYDLYMTMEGYGPLLIMRIEFGGT